MKSSPIARAAPLVQGSIYLVSGLWPIFHLRSFERVTGPKADGWLVKTVGGLLAVTGAALLVDGVSKRPSAAMRVVGAGTAGVLATVDMIYVSRGRISRIYLADAAMQLGIATSWIFAALADSRS